MVRSDKNGGMLDCIKNEKRKYYPCRKVESAGARNCAANIGIVAMDSSKDSCSRAANYSVLYIRDDSVLHILNLFARR